MTQASRSVDVVVVDSGPAAIRMALESAQRGERVLVVVGACDRCRLRRIRQSVRAAGLAGRRVALITNCELVCVDGVGVTEAVVIRHLRTGRLTAFNARRVSCISIGRSALSRSRKLRTPNETAAESRKEIGCLDRTRGTNVGHGS